MHHVARFCMSVEWVRTCDPTGRIGVMLLAMQRVGVDLPRSAARRGTRPRSSRAGSEEAECDGSEQCAFQAAGW